MVAPLGRVMSGEVRMWRWFCPRCSMPTSVGAPVGWQTGRIDVAFQALAWAAPRHSALSGPGPAAARDRAGSCSAQAFIVL